MTAVDRTVVEAAVEAATRFRDAWREHDANNMPLPGSACTFATAAGPGYAASLTELQLTAVLAELERLRKEPRAACYLCTAPLGITVCTDCAEALADEGERLAAANADLAARDETEPAAPCGHDGDSLMGRYPLICALPHGHAGFHSDGRGASWTNLESSALDALAARDGREAGR